MVEHSPGESKDLGSIPKKGERDCEIGTDNQHLPDSQWTNSKYLMDSLYEETLYEETQKAGVKCLP